MSKTEEALMARLRNTGSGSVEVSGKREFNAASKLAKAGLAEFEPVAVTGKTSRGKVKETYSGTLKAKVSALAEAVQADVKKLKRKSYPSLTAVLAELEATARSRDETIMTFDGYQIITNRARYLLFDGHVDILPN